MFSAREISGLTAVSTLSELPSGVMAMTPDVLANAREVDPGFPRNVRVIVIPGRGRLILSPADFERASSARSDAAHEGDPRMN